jgi:hypothetical protein
MLGGVTGGWWEKGSVYSRLDYGLFLCNHRDAGNWLDVWRAASVGVQDQLAARAIFLLELRKAGGQTVSV